MSENAVSGEAEWVTVGEAVRLTGKAERTVWRWVHKGKVESRVTEDGRRELRKDTLPLSEGGGAGGLPTPAETGEVLAAQLRPLVEVLVAQRDEIRRLESRVERLTRILEERLPPPPPDPPALPPGGEPDPPEEPPPRPWWRFWRR